jgi:hypothetical protein
MWTRPGNLCSNSFIASKLDLLYLLNLVILITKFSTYKITLPAPETAVFLLLSAMHVITKAYYKTDSQREMLMVRNRPKTARTVKVYDHFCT